ncbi:MAG TPA: ribosome maturation factor RimM [Gammaproteobacteria bacterium]|nr:ribosome maturation factor RimM [Gammaproteobacteria bacterium]
MSDDDSVVIVGKVSGVYGVKGWLKVHSFTHAREDILGYKPWLMGRNGDWSTREVEAGQRHGKGIIAKLVGCDDRDQALALSGIQIAIKSEQLPELGVDDYYWSDLIGLQVETEAGVTLGVVDSLLETGANDVMVVKGDRERVIPYAQPEYVKSIDLHAGKMVVDWDPEF